MDDDDDDDNGDGDGDADADANADTDAKSFGGAKIFEKKVWLVAIDFVQKSSKSEPSSRFSYATFSQIQPIVPGFVRI